jgi:DNA-binding NtrC family response regulator
MRADDENAGAHMKNILSQQGYLVDVISNVNAAIDRVRQQKLDVIILDLRLTSLNTLDTYLIIRELRPNTVVVIIVRCRQVLNELAQQALQQIVYAFMQKPINIDELASLLELIKNDKNREFVNTPEESPQRI